MRQIGRITATGALFAGAVFILSGCSEVPDAVNPVQWYKGVTGWFEGDGNDAQKAKVAAARDEKIPGEKQSFPTLSEVPKRPVPMTTVEERRKLIEGLAADRANARYTDQVAGAAPGNASVSKTGKAPAATRTAGAKSGSAARAGVKTAAKTAPSGVAKSSKSRMAAKAAAKKPPAQRAPSVAAAKPGKAPFPSPPAAVATAGKTRPAAVASAKRTRAKKSYLSPLEPGSPYTAAPSPPKSREPRSAPRTPVKAEPSGISAVAAGKPAPSGISALAPKKSVVAAKKPVARTAPSASGAPGVNNLNEIYRSMLAQSAPTVTTTPAGPVAKGVTAPRSLEQFDTSGAALSVQVGTVLFGNNSSKLTAAGRRQLRDIVKIYKQRGGTIRVVGHASSRTRNMDPMRHQLANFTISMRRADVVARKLMHLGVKPSDLFVGAKSDSEPIYYESMPAGEAGNRRAEIFIDY